MLGSFAKLALAVWSSSKSRCIFSHPCPNTLVTYIFQDIWDYRYCSNYFKYCHTLCWWLLFNCDLLLKYLLMLLTPKSVFDYGQGGEETPLSISAFVLLSKSIAAISKSVQKNQTRAFPCHWCFWLGLLGTLQTLCFSHRSSVEIKRVLTYKLKATSK